MHASDMEPEMNEETFQILFDVMEKHFAALKLLDTDSDFKLTRAVSFSELPTTRRICVEQYYQTGDSPGLVRQYSCEQILDKSLNTREFKISEVVKTENEERKKTWKTTAPLSDSFKIPEWVPRKKNVVQPSKLVPTKVEYMDVEDTDYAKHSILSSPSPPLDVDMVKPSLDLPKKPLEVDPKVNLVSSANENMKTNYQDIKKKLRPLVPTKEVSVKKRGKMNRCCSYLCFVFLPIAFVFLAIIANLKDVKIGVCKRSLIFSNASVELQKKIHGQTEGLRELLHHLNRDEDYLNVVCLVGGSGVGKSYTADIIRRNFPYENEVFLYFPPLKDGIKVEKIFSKSSKLVILENLKKNDLSDVVRSLKMLDHFENHCVTILAIFNVERVNNDLIREVNLEQSVAEIELSFRENSLAAAVIPYVSLSEETLLMCIKNAASGSGLELTWEQISRIKDSLLLNNSGCKGAYAKVQIIGRE